MLDIFAIIVDFCNVVETNTQLTIQKEKKSGKKFNHQDDRLLIISQNILWINVKETETGK